MNAERLTRERVRLLSSRAHILEPDLLAFMRLSENARTVQWLADAGALDLNKALVRFEVQYCRQVIWQIPGFAQVRIGETRFRGRSAAHSIHPTPPRSLPPPIPARFGGKE